MQQHPPWHDVPTQPPMSLINGLPYDDLDHLRLDIRRMFLYMNSRGEANNTFLTLMTSTKVLIEALKDCEEKISLLSQNVDFLTERLAQQEPALQIPPSRGFRRSSHT